MHYLPKNVQKLIDHFTRLPGIGPKTASRLVLFLLHSPKEYVADFSFSLTDVKENVRFCTDCFNLSEGERCSICEDEARESNKILVLEDILDLLAFESMGDFQGKYHVLGGLISPIQGVGPDDLNINRLLARVKQFKNNSGLEVIIATNPNLEGEATAMYLNNELLKLDPSINVTRIARGVPTGADLDYADRVTLLRSLEGRVKI